MKTIKQIADEIGVSKQTIRNEVYRQGLQSSLQSSAKGFAVDEETEKRIVTAILERRAAKQPQTLPPNLPQTLPPNFAVNFAVDLQKELDEKNAQIERLQKENAELLKQNAATAAALENVTQALRAAQALHAGTMQERIEEKAETAVQDLTTQQDTTQDVTTQRVTSETKKKKWWEFWKK